MQLMARLDIHDVTGLVRYAIRMGWSPPTSERAPGRRLAARGAGGSVRRRWVGLGLGLEVEPDEPLPPTTRCRSRRRERRAGLPGG